jgi:hypothetical protein
MKIPNFEKISTEKREELLDKLKEILDCSDFVHGVFAYLRSNDEADNLLNFINNHPKADSSTILIYLLALKKQRNK